MVLYSRRSFAFLLIASSPTDVINSFLNCFDWKSDQADDDDPDEDGREAVCVCVV